MPFSIPNSLENTYTQVVLTVDNMVIRAKKRSLFWENSRRQDKNVPEAYKCTLRGLFIAFNAEVSKIWTF